MSGWAVPASLPAEPASRATAGFVAGGVGIADAGRDSGGSQWFVCTPRRRTSTAATRGSARVPGRGRRRVPSGSRRARDARVRCNRRPSRPAIVATAARPDRRIDRTARVVRSMDHMRRHMLATLIRRSVVAHRWRSSPHGTPALAKGHVGLRSLPPPFVLLGRPIGGAKPAKRDRRVPHRLAHRRGRRRRARRSTPTAAQLLRTDARRHEDRRELAIGSNAGLLDVRPTRRAPRTSPIAAATASRWSRSARQARAVAALEDAGRAVRRRAVARPQDRCS